MRFVNLFTFLITSSVENVNTCSLRYRSTYFSSYLPWCKQYLMRLAIVKLISVYFKDSLNLIKQENWTFILPLFEINLTIKSSQTFCKLKKKKISKFSNCFWNNFKKRGNNHRKKHKNFCLDLKVITHKKYRFYS